MKKKSIIIMIYDGMIDEDSSATYKKSIICKNREQAKEYLSDKGYIRQDKIPNKKMKKRLANVPKDKLLYVNIKKHKVAGLLEAEQYK